MSWLLNNVSSGSAYIPVPSVTIGGTIGDYIEIKANANAGNSGSIYRPLGDYTLGGNANIVQIRTTNLQMIAGSTNMGWTAGYTQPAVGSDFVLRFVKASSTQWQAILNGTSLGLQSGSTSFLLSAIFKINATTTESFRGKIYYVEISTNGGSSPTRYYDPNASGGTGTILHDTVGGQNGTQAGTWPSDDSEWVFYSSGEGVPFTGALNKSTLTLSTKPQVVNAGFNLSTNKSTLVTNGKQLIVQLGTVLGVGKRTLILTPKNPNNVLGFVNTSNKTTIPFTVKQLEVVVGSNLPFLGSIGKQPLSLTSKQLGSKIGWNNILSKTTLNLTNEQLSNTLGFVSDINKQSLSLSTKPLTVITGTNVPVNALLNKTSLLLNSEQLDVTVGTDVSFSGAINKTTLNLVRKQLFVVSGFNQDIHPLSMNVSYKLLQWVDYIQPLVFESDRTFIMKDKNTVYIMKPINTQFYLN